MDALHREEAASPADINQLSYKDYIRSENEKGLGLKLGTAQRLARAIAAWRKGEDLDGNLLERLESD